MASDMQGRMARKAMSKKAEGMLEPLLSIIDEDDSSSSSSSSDESSQYSNSTGASSISVKVKRTKMQKLKTGVVTVSLGIGVVVSAGAMIITPVTAVFVMGGVLVANVPYSALKEYQIIKLPGKCCISYRSTEQEFCSNQVISHPTPTFRYIN